jgi:protein gp37
MSTTTEKEQHINSKPGSAAKPLQTPIHHPKKATAKLKLGDKPAEDEAKKAAEEKKLNKADAKELAACKKILDESAKDEKTAFFQIAAAIAVIKSKRLYRETHASFEGYIVEGWGYGRSHAKRLAEAGEIIARQKMAPRGAITTLMSGESFFRPLAKLEEAAQDAVIDLLGTWKGWDQHERITPRMVDGAVLFLNPPAAPTPAEPHKLIKGIVAIVDEVKKQVPKTAGKDIKALFELIKKNAVALGNPTGNTGIELKDATWIPLILNDIIRLLPEQLGDPLRDRTPRRYSVNSMSDLFHAKVPDEFITTVFDVMTKASWHQFQVLTKRPERMAEFTIKYFAGKQPPENIWLGASAENQAALDERLPHLLKVVAAVRWLSCEPLIGPIEFDTLDGIDWVVLGGESGKGARKMELAWAATVRDACKEAEVSFFFKQWGLYGPDGKKLKKTKKDGLTPPALEGKIHDEYPQPRVVASEKIVEAEIISVTPVPAKKAQTAPAHEGAEHDGDAVSPEAQTAPANETEASIK